MKLIFSNRNIAKEFSSSFEWEISWRFVTHTGAGAAMNTSFSGCATHPWSWEPPVSRAHLVARRSAGKTRQTHCGPLCLRLSQVCVSGPSGRHGASLVQPKDPSMRGAAQRLLTRVCLRHRLFEYLPSQLSVTSRSLCGRAARGPMTVHFAVSPPLLTLPVRKRRTDQATLCVLYWWMNSHLPTQLHLIPKHV